MGQRILTSNSDALRFLFDQFKDGLKLAIPLGVGKPNVLVNSLYEKCKQRSDYKLEIYTGLSLDTPSYKNPIEKKLVQPVFDELLGRDYPYLKYVRDQKSHSVPANIRIFEFYMQPGAQLGNFQSQQDHVNINYTHVIHQVVDHKIQCVLQAIAKRADGRLSLGTNPDLTADLKRRSKERGQNLLLIGVVNSEMPYTTGDAEVDANFFDVIIESSENNHPLFTLPHQPIDNVDLAVGLNASLLLVDDGTLQIGIGSLTDALAASLIFRQHKNVEYRRATEDILISSQLKTVDRFEAGVFGTSELVTDAFVHLERAAIVNREVQVKRLNRRLKIEGAFLLGSKDFYKWVRQQESDDSIMAMTSVAHINDLYEDDESELRRERKNARFFNTCMGVSIFGDACSETLPDGRVISGVGGQYNFVSMAHELRDARSVLMFRSEYSHKGKMKSNVHFSAPFVTIPRHLRDIFVNEYGVADTRYMPDGLVIDALVQIADVKFQDELIVSAQKSGKLRQGFRPTPKMKMNSIEQVNRKIDGLKLSGLLSEYPFGTEFSPVQKKLISALTEFQKLSAASKIIAILSSFTSRKDVSKELQYLNLSRVPSQIVKAALVRL